MEASVAVIRNNRVSIAVASRGAELQSLRDVARGREWLWQGDAAWWSSRSPILFPIIGNVVDGAYQYEGVRYEMGGHGFALSSEFELKAQSADELVYRLVSTPETRRVYPFDFVLDATYRLVDATVVMGFEVRNTGGGGMLFSVGGHPGFNTERMEDFYLEFEKPEHADRRMHPHGLLDGTTRRFLDGNRVAPLYHEIFDEGAVVLGGLVSRWVTLAARGEESKVRVVLGDLPYLGIWSPVTPSPFVCIEPWHGIPSTVGDSPELSAKAGMISLAPGKTWTCAYKVEVL